MKDQIENFYIAFKNLDAERMISYYHEDVVFEDPAFGVLEKKRACHMWKMLCESQRDKDFQLDFSDIQYDNELGFAKWEARYTFSQTGRKVHNKINAKFRFKDGKIIHHVDHFNLSRWARQAMGFKGLLLGGTGYFKSALQKQTNSLLDKFESQTKKATEQ